MYYLINKQTKEHIPNPTPKQRAGVMCDKNWDIVLVDDDGWIPNSNPRVRPLPDHHKCIAKFIDGAHYKPIIAKMWNFDNTMVAYKPIFEDEHVVTFQSGDHVPTNSTTEEDTYWDGVEWPAPIGSKVKAEDEFGTWREGVVGYQVNDPNDGKMVLVDFGDDWIIVSPPDIRKINAIKKEWIEAAKGYFCNDDATATMEIVYDAIQSGELSSPNDLT